MIQFGIISQFRETVHKSSEGRQPCRCPPSNDLCGVTIILGRLFQYQAFAGHGLRLLKAHYRQN